MQTATTTYYWSSMPLLRLLVSLLLFIAFSYSQPSFALNTIEEYLNCSRVTTFSCGDDVETEIKYPFRTNDQPEYCGRPDYNLTCSGDDHKTLSFKIGGKTYRVRKSIDYEAKILDLIDADLFAAVTSNSCPEEISNTTGLESSFLTYLNNDINLTFFLRCNSSFSLPGINLWLSPITYCSNDFFGQTSFFTLHREAITLDVSHYCSSIVSVPVYNQFNPDDFITGGKTFFDALKVGFGLTWTVGQSWCGECTKDGGLCGNNVSHPNEPACLCPPGTTNTGPSCTRSTNDPLDSGLLVGLLPRMSLPFNPVPVFSRSSSSTPRTRRPMAVLSRSAEIAALKERIDELERSKRSREHPWRTLEGGDGEREEILEIEIMARGGGKANYVEKKEIREDLGEYSGDFTGARAHGLHSLGA
ncbi:hypothetical protein J5N97_007544 [Dioscorea zingiberensis]|uniref:Uncharacterized protein n=1 Tax=Dioscorea zingiberensis TaxID=325984 RepID=A0A9D5DBZ4_9LILI|nr:hypothetical protein J5N97_007544 [Dioscorea zingiberensis]